MSAGKRIEKKNLMEAVIAAAVLVAAADGDISPKEIDSMEALVKANPSLQHFGSEIDATLTKYKNLVAAGPRMAKLQLMREVADVSGVRAEAEEVLVTAITIAEASGDIDAKEKVALEAIAKALNLSLNTYLA